MFNRICKSSHWPVAALSAALVCVGCSTSGTSTGDGAADETDKPSQSSEHTQAAEPAAGSREGTNEASDDQDHEATSKQNAINDPTGRTEPAGDQGTATAVPAFVLPDWPSRPVDSAQLRQEASDLALLVVETAPQDPNAWEVKARFDLLFGETNAAKRAWEQALKLDGGYAFALHGIGKVAVLNGRFDAAIEALRRAYEKLPDLADVVHDLSNAYTKNGQVEQSVKVLEEYVRKHPDATETYVLLGNAHLTLRQFEAARDSFTKALELYPDLPRAQQGLGAALVRLGDRERARELLAAQRKSRTAEAKNRSADEVFRDELSETAVRYSFAARVLQSTGDVPAAVKALMKAVVLDPNNGDTWGLLIDLLSINKYWDAGVEVAQRMVSENPQNANFHFTLGGLQVRAGRIADARDAFKRVIELLPGAAQGYEALVRVNVQTQFDQAATLKLAQELVEVRGSANDYELLGQANAVAGRYSEAKQALAKAIKLEPSNDKYQMAMQKLQRFLDSR